LRNDKTLSALAVWTDHQTAGRGRSGRNWVSVPGASLCLSVAYRFGLGFQPVEGFSVAAGAALVQVLRRHGASVDLKWPNDLLFQGRKLGGVLCEAVTSELGQVWVAGVGINLAQFEVPATAHALCSASLSETAVSIVPASLAQELAQALLDILTQADQGALIAGLLTAAATFDPWLGQTLQVLDHGVSTQTGISRGVDEKGQYRLQTATGEIRLRHGELSLRATQLQKGLLLIDIGNSRLKWCSSTLSEHAPLSVEHASSHDFTPEAIASLYQSWRHALRDFESVELVVACVGKPEWLNVIAEFAQLEKHGFHQVTAVATYAGLINSYNDPRSLGVDRFCALLALVKRKPGQVAVLVSAGTATTIDAVDETGRFLGGMILPGVRMMRNALEKNTAQLPQVEADFSEFPVTTQQAISSGIRSAQLGAITAVLARLSARSGREPICVLTGGDANWLETGLGNAQCVPDLVMQGLRWWALEKKTDGDQ
jgi:biotin-[acetyl-CoA-carboxylase] ligase/type 3 pantothenate kinase